MSRKFLLLTGFSALAFAQPAFAQDAAAPAPESGAETGGLEEIVVTAQKREQNLQNVPVSVTALNSEALERNRIADFSDLTRAAPSLTVTQATTSPNNSIILRGIGTFAFSIGVEPSVAVIVDDLPVVQQAQAFDTLGDVQRIEVLKGPQGTLFGKAASAGVVNIVTKEPSKELSGSLAATAATDEDYRLEASLSGPIGSNESGFRLGAFYRSFKGNVHNLTTGHWLNDSEAYGLRGKLKLVITPDVSLTLGGTYAKTTQDGTASTLRSIAGTPRILGNAAAPLVPTLTGITVGAGNQDTRIDSEGPTTNRTATVSARLVADLGGVNLIAVTGYQDWKYNFSTDVDATDYNLMGLLTGGTLSGGLVQSGPYHSQSFTQEVRLVSTGQGPFKYVIGGFFANSNTKRAFNRGPLILLSSWDSKATSRSTAIFAQADYTLPTNTTISGGLRYNNERVGVQFDNLLANATGNTCIIGNPACRGQHNDDVVTWKASISQELAPKVMVYGSVAKGYKGWAYDVSSGFNPARIDAALSGTGAGLSGVGPVKAEHSTSYELGLKSRFMDNKVQLNLTGFVTDYNNFQAQSAVIINLAPQFVLNNVGKLKTKGVEAELSVKPNDWLRLDGSASYTDAKMTSFPGAQGYSDQTGATWNGSASVLAAGCTSAPAATAVAPRSLCSFQDRSGAALPNSPKFKFALGATGEFPLGGDNKGSVTLGYQHQSKVNFDLLGNPLLEQAAYGIFNASLGAEFGPVKATLFVNNLFNTHYAAGLSDGFSTFGGSATNPAHVIAQIRPRDSDRYFGLKLQYAFGG